MKSWLLDTIKSIAEAYCLLCMTLAGDLVTQLGLKKFFFYEYGSCYPVGAKIFFFLINIRVLMRFFLLYDF